MYINIRVCCSLNWAHARRYIHKWLDTYMAGRTKDSLRATNELIGKKYLDVGEGEDAQHHKFGHSKTCIGSDLATCVFPIAWSSFKSKAACTATQGSLSNLALKPPLRPSLRCSLYSPAVQLHFSLR